MRHVVAIAFSDLHINDWAKFNQDGKRTSNQFEVLSLIQGLCHKYNCPALFCGDMFHRPEHITPELAEQVVKHFETYDFTMLYIKGNHSMSQANTLEKPSPSWFNVFKYPWMISVNQTSYSLRGFGEKDITVWGVPYLDHNIGLNEYVKSIQFTTKKNILLLHSDYPGAKDSDGSEVGTAENLNTNLLQKFDLVLMGHIHKPQRLGKKIIMVGAPLQQRRTDKDCEFGYWKIYSDMTAKFKPFDQFPKFIDVESQEDIKDDGNYYTVIGKKVEVETTNSKPITKDLSKKKLVRRYLKAQGIKDKKKSEVLINLLKEADND